MKSQAPNPKSQPNLPEWRRGAGAGIPLAVAQAKAGPSRTAQQAPVKAGPDRLKAGLQTIDRRLTPDQESGAPGAPPRAMETVLRPNVRDRWLSSQISYFTPQIVENTARGAMAGNLLAQWLMFDLMEQTWPRLSKNLNELKGAVVDLDRIIQPYALRGAKPTAEAERRAEKCEQVLWQMDPDPAADENEFDDTLRDIMDAVGKGISVSEILWMEPGDPDNQTGLWMPRATKWTHPRYYGYPSQPGTEDRLMLNMMEVRFNNPNVKLDQSLLASSNTDWVGGQFARFPKDQFIVSIFKQKSGHPISGAMLRLLGFLWSAQNFCWEWHLNLAQIFGVPIRWAEYPPTAQLGTITAIEDMLANMGSAGWAAFPAGTKLNIYKALENARDNPAKQQIDAGDIICDIVILGQTLTTQQGERGSQALGTIHKSVRDERIQAVGSRTAKVFRQLLRAICRLNFGDDKECPFLNLASKESKDALANAQRDQILLAAQVPLPKQWFYERHDIPVPEAGEETITGPVPAPAMGNGNPKSQIPNPNATARAHDATDKLTERVLEDLTGVEAKWLGGMKPLFRRLCAAALSDRVTDAQFIKTLEQAQARMPELFDKLDHAALAKALEGAMGAAVVNGAVRGYLARPIGSRALREGAA